MSQQGARNSSEWRTKFYKQPKNSKTIRKKAQLMLENCFGANYSSINEKCQEILKVFSYPRVKKKLTM